VGEALDGGAAQFGDFELQWEPALKDRADLPRARRIRVMFHLSHRDPWFWGHATRPEIVDTVENLLGPDLIYYTDQLFVKGAYNGSAVPWHQDSAYWPVDPPKLLSCWMALDDATVENGCVRVIPGTHRRAIPHTHFKEGPQSLGLLQHEVDLSKEIPVEIPAGGAMFHHSLLIHRSEANRSAKGRRGLVSIYLPAECRFTKPWDFKYGFKVLRGRARAECIGSA
jgi:ectoine hydroxylase-related dioxygenase (phytanoyl-CoA dioxygenase family)